MVYHEFRRRQRIDAVRAAAELDHRIAHRRKVSHGRYPGKVLQYPPARNKGNLRVRLGLRIPVRERQDILARYVPAVLVPQQVFQEDLERVGQSTCVTFLDGVESVY